MAKGFEHGIKNRVFTTDEFSCAKFHQILTEGLLFTLYSAAS